MVQYQYYQQQDFRTLPSAPKESVEAMNKPPENRRFLMHTPRAIFLFSALFCVGGVLAFARVEAATSGVGVGLAVSNLWGFVVQWAVPEGRVGAPGTNWSTNFVLTAHPTNDPSATQTSAAIETTDEQGASSAPLSFVLVGGQSYDVLIKTDQHLARKLTLAIPSSPSTPTLNFTQADNSAPLGSVRLLAGDVNGAGNTPTTLGDNVVNAVDLSLSLNHLDESDPTTKGLRTNLNRDTVVNATDLSLLLGNLDVEGDR